MDTKEPSHIIVQMIHKHIDYSIQIKINERNKTDDPEHQKRITDDIKTYSKMYSDVDKSGSILWLPSTWKRFYTIVHFTLN